ncbi:MAG: hypothetical protein OEL77_03755 [Nitrosopumilus sp.]|nr:hypothetical protein [Nitrosopumilus sp.]MDH3385113.1 hypothetical protein [Nitrosopumilus sp.]
MKILYTDRYFQIYEDKINFKSWVLPWGKKEVKIGHIKKISEKRMGIFSGKNRVSGTGNFRDWFHFDMERSKKDKAIVLETDFRIYKKLWLTPERYTEALNVLNKIILKK